MRTTPKTTAPPPTRQDQPSSTLVRPGHDLTKWLNACPSARCITGYSLAEHRPFLIQIRCRRWSCPVCGRRKIGHYAKRVEAAEPNRFLTLTVSTKLWKDPREAYDETRRQCSPLFTLLRKEFGSIEYFRVLEVTKKGWPHYHYLIRSDYLPHQRIKSHWQRLTGAYIVDIRPIKTTENAYWYTVKYLAKQDAVPWTDRRCTWSRRFFRKQHWKKQHSLKLEDVERQLETPQQWLEYYMEGKTIYRYSQDAWTW